MRTICLDYDGSYTEFPELFKKIISHCKENNIEVIMATMRHESEENKDLKMIQEEFGVKVIYSGRKAKLPFLGQMGIFPNLWIDDKPHWLYNDSK